MKTISATAYFFRQAWLATLLFVALFSQQASAAMGDLLATIPKQVNRLAINPVNNEIYATTNTSLLVFASGSLSVTTEISLPGTSQGVAVSPDGNTVYVATATPDQLTVIDVNSRTVLAPIVLPYSPYDVVVGNGNRLYVSPGQTGTYQNLIQVDASNGTYTTPYINNVFMYYSSLLQISPDRNTLYIGDEGLSGAHLYKIDVSTATIAFLAKNTNVGSNGQDLAIDSTGNYIYFAVGSGNGIGYNIQRIVTSSLQPDVAVSPGGYPHAVAVYPGESLLFTSSQSGSIKLWDMNNPSSVVQSLTVSSEADKMIVDRSNSHIFAAFDSVSQLRVYDITITCLAGTYLHTGVCTTAPVGTYTAAGAYVPIKCPDGTYNPATGSTDISACLQTPAGYYSSAGSGSYTIDPAGTYSEAGAASSTLCPAGTYNPVTGSTDISACLQTPAGSYAGAGSASYITDPVGTYSGAGAASPTLCPAGTYNPVTGSTDISACLQTPAGSYAGAGSASYKTDPVGTYSGTDAASPTLCPGGTYNPVTGSTDISACLQTPAGSYSGAGSASYITDPVGTYSGAGAALPTQCQGGTYNPNTGGTSNSSCIQCPAGTYNPLMGTADISACLQTPAGSYSGAGSASYTIDSAGTYSGPGSAAPTSCPAGTSSYWGSTSITNCFTDANGNGLPDTLEMNSLGIHAGDLTGSQVQMADMNNDGVLDLVIGIPGADITSNGKTLSNAGLILILSGKDGSVINALGGASANEKLGSIFAITKSKDILVGDPNYNAVVTVGTQNMTLHQAGAVGTISATTGALLGYMLGSAVGEHFGASIAVGDILGTSCSDFLIGSPGADYKTVDAFGKAVTYKDAGKITVFHCGNQVYTFNGTQAREHFGAAVAIDSNLHLVLVGSPDYDDMLVIAGKSVKHTDAGRVQVFDGSGLVSTPLVIVIGQNAGDHFGAALASFNQDLDGDGLDDWAVGIPGFDISTVVGTKTVIQKDIGRVEFFSGTNATPLAQHIDGAAAGDNLGAALATGDINGDGKNDLAIGSPKYDVSTSVSGKTVILKDAGRVEVVNSAQLF